MKTDRVSYTLGRYCTPHMRVVSLRLFLCAMAMVTMLATSVSAQYLETTIDLSPVGSVINLDCIAVNPVTHTVYVGGDGWVAVIDGAGLSYEKRVQVGHRCHALTYVPAKNKLCATCWLGEPAGAVYVIDCGTNQVRACISVSRQPHSLCYDSLDNKVYWGFRGHNT